MSGPARAPLHRGAVTWYAYVAQTVYAAVLYGQGPVAALVRREQGLSYLAVSVLPALLSAGAVAGGLLAGRLLRDGARDASALVRGALVVVAAGVAGMALPWTAAVGAGFLVAGAAGAFLIASVTVVLRRTHGDLVGRALLEVNVIAAGGGVAQTALIGLAASAGAWRWGLVPVLVAAVGLAGWPVRARAASRADAEAEQRAPVLSRAVRLSTATRWYVAGTMVGGALEFAVVLWAADVVVSTTGTTAAAAAGTLTAFTGGLVAGRALASRVAGTPEASRRVLVWSFALAGSGAVALVLAPTVAGAVVALAVTGVGVAALFPLGLALAVATAGDEAARASAVTVAGVAFAVLVTPVAFAALADAVGVRRAFWTVPLLVVLGVTAVARAASAAGRPGPPDDALAVAARTTP